MMHGEETLADTRKYGEDVNNRTGTGADELQ